MFTLNTYARRALAAAASAIAIGLIGGFKALAAAALLAGAYCIFSMSGDAGHAPPPRPRRARLRVWISNASFIEGDNLVMRITSEQKVKVTVAPKTAGGHDATIDGDVAFTSSDDTVARIDPIDGSSCYVTAVGPGAAQISASFDADLGEGVREITASGALEVVAAEADTAEIVFGDAEQQ